MSRKKKINATFSSIYHRYSVSDCLHILVASIISFFRFVSFRFFFTNVIMKMTIFRWDGQKNYLSMVLEFSYFGTKIKKQRPEKNAVNSSEPITIPIWYCEEARDRMERRKKNEKGNQLWVYVLRFYDLMRLFFLTHWTSRRKNRENKQQQRPLLRTYWR